MEGLINAQDVQLPPAAAVLSLPITESQAAQFPTLDRLLQGTGQTMGSIQNKLMIACMDGTRPERIVSAAHIINMYRYDTAEVLLFMSGMLCSIPLKNFGRCYHELQQASIEAMAMLEAIQASNGNVRMDTVPEDEEVD